MPIMAGRTAKRQSYTVVIHAMNGTKTSCPAAKADVRIPTTSPLLRLNHRMAIVEASPSPMIPAAIPRHTPMLTSKCHFSNARTVSNRPKAFNMIERRTTLTTPILSINAAPKGHKDASMKYINAVAVDTSEMFQPNSLIMGRISICGTLPTADENTVAETFDKPENYFEKFYNSEWDREDPIGLEDAFSSKGDNNGRAIFHDEKLVHSYLYF